MWVFDTVVEPPKEKEDFVGKKCFRCGAAAVKVTVVGESDKYDPKPVYAYACERSPYCSFLRGTTSSF